MLVVEVGAVSVGRGEWTRAFAAKGELSKTKPPEISATLSSSESSKPTWVNSIIFMSLDTSTLRWLG